MNIKFGNPNIEVTDDLIKNMTEILKSGWVSIGKHMEALENHFREKCGVKHAIACASATTGLIIAIKAAGWKNERVALPSFTWPSTLYALECNGNEPVFIDVDRDTWIPDYEFTPHRKMIIVDTFGNEAPVYKHHGDGEVIYDAAHGYGLPNLGKRGLAEVVSFSFTKRVTATEGGIILTNDDNLAETAIELRRLSGRMEEINALVAMESIRYYADDYSADVINHYIKHITVPFSRQQIISKTNNSVFSILFEDTCVRNAIVTALAVRGVETKVYYDPLKSGLPNTDHVYSRILSLPIHRGVIPVQDEIIEIINTAGRSARTPGKGYLTT